jgi:endogenous inhibitor of DNA gyrase (YacG/DUF329 family)
MAYCIHCGVTLSNPHNSFRPYCGPTCRSADVAAHVLERDHRTAKRQATQAQWAAENKEIINLKAKARREAKAAAKGKQTSTSCTKRKPRTEEQKAVDCLNTRQHDRDTCIHYGGCATKAGRQNLPTVCTCDCANFTEPTLPDPMTEFLRSAYDLTEDFQTH